MCVTRGTGNACAGDSGGPLVIPGDSDTSSDDVVVGLSSFGLYDDDNNCVTDTWSGFARITSKLNWINSVVCFHSIDPPEDFPCGTLPFLTLEVSGSSGDITISIDVEESEGQFETIITTSASASDGLFETLFLYPKEEGTRQYTFNVHAGETGEVDDLKLWLGDPLYNNLLHDTTGTFTFTIQDDGAVVDAQGKIIVGGPETTYYTQLEIVFGNEPGEVSWSLVDAISNEQIFTVLPSQNAVYQPGATLAKIDLGIQPDRSYLFEISDANGNGLQSYSLYLLDSNNNSSLIAKGDTVASEETLLNIDESGFVTVIRSTKRLKMTSFP
uniref:Peptidase S1 domain-containing protein n=1 Tax=Grammatophora oceanica TaxID=210454 RepID=A0A7S1Y699_9STRA